MIQKTKSCAFLLFFCVTVLADSARDLAKQIHSSSLVIDGHNDLAWRLREEEDMSLTQTDLNKSQLKFHTDIPRLRKGGVGAQFWSAYVPAELMKTGEAVKVTLEQMDLIHRIVNKYSDTFEFANTSDDILRIYQKGKIASMIGIEGGHSINNSLETLRELYRKGARYMTLSHSLNLDWVESATDKPMATGLTEFGKKVVLEMNRLGMFVDISHISAKAMRKVMVVSKAPVIASHSSSYALTNHVRNIPDDVLKLVAKNSGVVMVNFYPSFIAAPGIYKTASVAQILQMPSDDCTQSDIAQWKREKRIPVADLKRAVDHIDHIVQVAGIDHVGLGADFDGIPSVSVGLEDVSTYPHITEELLRRGYTEKDIKKILGGNLVHAFKEMERIAKTFPKE